MSYMLKRMYGLFLLSLKKLIGADFAKKFDTYLRYRRALSLKDPKTLSDKLAYIENHCQTELATLCTDKWEVRKFVIQKGLSDILVPVYGEVYNRFEEIPFDIFPEQFVLKATHGCKMNYICLDKKKLSLKECKKAVNKWIKTSYGAYSCEWHYLDIPHRVYCEEYLSLPEGLVDYKFYCFHGEPKFILACSDRKVDENGKMTVNLDLLDINWSEIDGLNDNHLKGHVRRPQTFERMMEIARTLSDDFKFVRVDLYELNEKVMFGELTFTPAACVFPDFKEDFLEEWGKELNIH